MPDIDYHIIFVDDDRDFLLFINTAMSSYPFKEKSNHCLKLHYLSNALESIALINRLNKNNEKIAVIVTDQKMPDMMGIELLEKTGTLTPKTFKILLTAYGSLESAKYAINNSLLDQYITKPIDDPDNFAVIINNALNAYHIREEKEKAEEEAKMYIQQLEENNKKIKIMHKAAEKITYLAQGFNNLNLEEVFGLIINKLPDVFNAKNASLFLVNEEDNNLHLARSNFLNEEYRLSMETQSTAPMIVALRENRIIVVPDIKQSDSYTFLGKKCLGNSCIIIPFSIGKDENTTGDILGNTMEVRGVLNLGKIESMESTDIVLYSASLIQNLMGINILNANLYKKTTRMALIDGLTGLYNKQVFLEFLDKEREFSERRDSPFFLAFFDIDDFKKINDTYGHLIGDEVLKILGAVFLRAARKSDIIARFGGEEFAWIIHCDDKAECFNSLERIRNEICTTLFPKDITISVSIGLAQYTPNNHDCIEDLINHADNAMYQAKREGKNRTIMNNECDPHQFLSGIPNLIDNPSTS